MQKVKRSRLTRGVCRVFGVLWLALLMFSAAALAQDPTDWTVGDVFVAVQAMPPGSTSTDNVYQVWHSANPTASKPTFSLLQTIIGVGTTAGCNFDSANRLFGTDLQNTDALGITIDNADDITAAKPSFSPVIRTIPASVTNANGKTNAVAFSGNKLYVGYAHGGLDVFQVDQASNQYKIVASFSAVTTLTAGSITVQQDGGVDWLDVTADGHTIVYTSTGTLPGRKIYTFDTTFVNNPGPHQVIGGPSVLYADLSTVNNTGPGPLGAIRIPPGGLAAGVLVADTANVKLVQALNGVITNIVKFTKFPGSDNNLQALTLDPGNPLVISGTSVTSGRFWAGDFSTNDVIWYDAAANKVVTHFTAGNVGTLRGMCDYGSFSPAQPAYTVPYAVSSVILSPVTTQTAVFNAQDCTGAGCTGSQFTASLIFNNTLNTAACPYSSVTLTLRSAFVDPSIGLSDPNDFEIYYDLNNNPVLTSVPGSMPCVKATSGPNAGQCEVFELEASPNCGFDPSNYHLTLGSSFPQFSTSACTTAPCDNPRIVRNMNEDVTDSIECCLTKSTNCVFSINQQTVPGAFVCPGYVPASGSTFNLGQSANFRFQAVTDLSNCQNGPFVTDLKPLLLFAQLPPKNSNAAGTGFPVDVKGSSSQTNLPPIFTISSGSNTTYQIQVDTTNLLPGTYFWTVVDLSGKPDTIPAFGDMFTILP